MRKIYLLALLIIPFALTRCSDDNPPNPPGPDPIPEGTIPVVFHVLYENAGSSQQSPPASVFQAHIDKINRFYAATLFPGAGSAAIDIKFELATKAPDGSNLAEPGIHRVSYSGSANMSADQFLSARHPAGSANAAVFWDMNRYVNIWVFGFLKNPGNEDDETYVSGISYMPYSTSSHRLDGLNQGDVYLNSQPAYMHGIVLNNNYFSRLGTDLNPGEGVLTFIHEMGHYLGVYHPFATATNTNPVPCTNPDDYSDDYCSDTPKYDRDAYGASYPNLPYGSANRMSCSGVIFPSTNIMDYYDGTRQVFTPQQKARIEHVLQYSPLIPRSTKATKALWDGLTGEPSDEIPEPIKIE